jgi:hypothetical protein
MIKSATIVKPSGLEGLYNKTLFIPPNSKDYLIKVDLGFKINPIYQQKKLCWFLPENIYYQQLILIDGKANPVKDDARTIVITGETEEPNPIQFNVDINPSLPHDAGIDTEIISLPFYPELHTEIVIRGNTASNTFYHFACTKIIHRPASLPYLQLKYLGQYQHGNLAAVLRKWHPDEITKLDNITNR